MKMNFLEDVLNKGAGKVAKFLVKQQEEGRLKDVDLENVNTTLIVGGTILAAGAAIGTVGALVGSDDEDNLDEQLELEEKRYAKEVVDEEMHRVEKEYHKKELKLAMYMDAFNNVGDGLKRLNDKNGATDDLVNEWTADFERVRKHKEELDRHDNYVKNEKSYTEIMKSRRNQMDIFSKETDNLAKDIADYIETGVEQYAEKEYVK